MNTDRIRTQMIFTPIGRALRSRKYAKLHFSDNAINATLNKWFPDGDVSLTGMNMDILKKEIRRCQRKFTFSAEEYFLYKLYLKSDTEKAEFVSEAERLDICDRFNNYKNQEIFDNKAKTYHIFSDFLGRDVYAWNGAAAYDRNTFAAFCEKHRRWFVKPIFGSLGRGCFIFEREGIEPDKIFRRLSERHPKGFCMEEIVKNCPEIAAFHPKSLNTVRITTVATDKETVILGPALRFGRGNSVVDNGGSGGIFSAIDEKTGTLWDAVDERGNRYAYHPDTNQRITGFTVPRWKEAVTLAKKLAKVIPDNRYTGWDIALTDTDWVLIEGNARGQFGWQVATGVGTRTRIEECLRQCFCK